MVAATRQFALLAHYSTLQPPFNHISIIFTCSLPGAHCPRKTDVKCDTQNHCAGVAQLIRHGKESEFDHISVDDSRLHDRRCRKPATMHLAAHRNHAIGHYRLSRNSKVVGCIIWGRRQEAAQVLDPEEIDTQHGNACYCG